MKLLPCCLAACLALVSTCSACSEKDLATVNKLFQPKMVRNLRRQNNRPFKNFFTNCPNPEIKHFQSNIQRPDDVIINGQTVTGTLLQAEKVNLASDACLNQAIECEKVSFQRYSKNGSFKIHNLKVEGCNIVSGQQQLSSADIQNLIRKVRRNTQGALKKCDKNFVLESGSGHLFGGVWNNVHFENEGCGLIVACETVNASDPAGSAATCHVDDAEEHRLHDHGHAH